MISGEEVDFPPGMMKAFHTCAYDLSMHSEVKWDETISSFQMIIGDTCEVLRGFPGGFMCFLETKNFRLTVLPICSKRASCRKCRKNT